MRHRKSRTGVARLFEPEDRLISMRLQQMYVPNPLIPNGDSRIARAEADGLLDERDHLLYRPGQEFAPAESGYGEHQIVDHA